MEITKILIISVFLLFAAFANAQELPDSVAVEMTELDEVVINQSQKGVRKLRDSAINTDFISKTELLRAACCNLGESFTTSASVDVNYSDAATGAKQIKLLVSPNHQGFKFFGCLPYD